MNDVVNPIAPPAPDFTPPSADVEISADVREFARAPVYVSPGVNREPTDAEQVARLVTARDTMGQSFWGPKSAPQPSAAERAAIETRESLGVRPGAQPSDFTVPLPAGVDPSAADMIKSAMSALELAPVMGNHLGQRIAEVGRRVHQMLTDADRFEYANGEQRKISEWADRHGWDLEAKRTEVTRLLNDRKVDPLIAGIAMHDFEVFVRLALHADHLKAMRR